ncbi:carboxymuconolactone decarboxylase family protein [Kiritimatiella glycovorans]|uniref:Alkylhydroperoxidase/carboxymuconolactone decarboxylase family protein n=1 Tax=Kiritimatiella glycovorans TaxID=1307763 RepID=A0A0G3EGU0_9BACT|nr:carboxymuconolactone decarboxylase family protein [Kiritimatiella glycovorans]AKJ63339.1 alkylhydroperoxidase/carboxymuconolactone decarboxylase family protein [Kiritimatiella glycovorans]
MSSEEVKKFYQDYKKDMGALKESSSEAMGAMGQLHKALMTEGALSEKQKELIALAIGVAVRCEPCIYLHTRDCLKAGASREEIMEAAQTAVMMQGGPAFTYLPKVLHALEACES